LRVEGDLAAGKVALARQRLTSLIASFPESLEVRDQLARVCRLQGDLVQAGRWSYLSDERVGEEVEKFEKATRDPVKRMRALKWATDPGRAATPVAREVLQVLLEQARAHTKDQQLHYAAVVDQEWRPPGTVGERLAVVAAWAVFFGVLGLFVVGVIDGIATVVSWMR
jgi:hypothetical protein